MCCYWLLLLLIAGGGGRSEDDARPQASTATSASTPVPSGLGSLLSEAERAAALRARLYLCAGYTTTAAEEGQAAGGEGAVGVIGNLCMHAWAGWLTGGAGC